MLDLKFIRENQELVSSAVKNKHEKVDLALLLNLDKKRRDLLLEADALKQEKNRFSALVPQMKKEGKDPREELTRMREVSDNIGRLDAELKQVSEKLDALLLRVPNVPHASVPVGEDEFSNQLVREWGNKPKFNFTPRPHWELAEKLNLVDLPRAAKVTGSGFILFVKWGARLERALINFMLDTHIREHGYQEISPPAIVNRDSMTGTGQLPKLEEDMYSIEKENLFLIPTAEVPVSNIHRDETLSEQALPVYYVAYTPCFRREAGAYGKETKGFVRVHQFDKVEMVKFVRPDDSYDELEKLVNNAEKILQLLELPYRVRLLCTGDLSFAAAKCYDLEVWAPGVERFLEVSSCSNFESFQARRMSLKFRSKPGGKSEFLHTLNGSGLALPRTVAAILENFQTEKGAVRIPKVLQPYLDGKAELS
ncbi:MAG: serine--tRNA ligase [candidate division Zixibacteria bacterium]|nr:serine--tRNA ligase [candidate division Zixibacteria bacterium]